MLGLRDQLAANPHMHFSATVLEHSMDLLGAQQRKCVQAKLIEPSLP